MEPSCRTFKNGTQRWRLPDGKLHRTDGPAIISWDGTEEWYFKGRRHRSDGPALIFKRGPWSQEWYQNGKKHRLDGPALLFSDGRELWYVDNVCLGERVQEYLSSSDSFIKFITEHRHGQRFNEVGRRTAFKLALHHKLLTKEQCEQISYQMDLMDSL